MLMNKKNPALDNSHWSNNNAVHNFVECYWKNNKLQSKNPMNGAIMKNLVKWRKDG